MISNFGMGNKLEVFYNENMDDTGGLFMNNKYSEQTKYQLDKESLELVVEAYNESKRILSENQDLLATMSELLLKNDVLTKKDIPYYMY